jgi:hypothetical protein
MASAFKLKRHSQGDGCKDFFERALRRRDRARWESRAAKSTKPLNGLAAVLAAVSFRRAG